MSNGGSADSGVQAIAGAVAAVTATVGLFVITGVVGRVQRNETLLFAAAVSVVVTGATMIAVGGLLGTGPPAEGSPRAIAARWVPLVGYGVSGSGIVLAVIAAVVSGAMNERPVVTASFTDDEARPFTATVKVDNLASNERVILMIDGLRETAKGDRWEPHTVYQAYIGPDSDGKVDHQASMSLPGLERYQAVGVKAYTGSPGEAFDDTPCTTYPRQVSVSDQTRDIEGLGPGCVIMEFAAAAPTSTPTPTPTPTPQGG